MTCLAYKINTLKIVHLSNKRLLNDKIGIVASEIAKDKKVRKLVHNFQIKCAYNFPKKYNGSCLDGRDITYKIVPDANIKFFITANIKIRALRRYKELKKIKGIDFEIYNLNDEMADYILMTNRVYDNKSEKLSTCFDYFAGKDIVSVKRNGLTLSTLRKIKNN